MNNLKDIHNSANGCKPWLAVVLSGFQWTIWRIYTTDTAMAFDVFELFYQDFNEQFEGYTQPTKKADSIYLSCFIRISMNNLKDIHNCGKCYHCKITVVLSGFQWTIWRIYTTYMSDIDKNRRCFIRISMNNLKDIHNINAGQSQAPQVVLSGFQWTIWRIYTTRW